MIRYVCQYCGYEISEETDEPCPQCGEKQWLDVDYLTEFDCIDLLEGSD